MGREKERFEDVQNEGRQHTATRLRRRLDNGVHIEEIP
jgi:hypothetical protein